MLRTELREGELTALGEAEPKEPERGGTQFGRRQLNLCTSRELGRPQLPRLTARWEGEARRRAAVGEETRAVGTRGGGRGAEGNPCKCGRMVSVALPMAAASLPLVSPPIGASFL